MEKIHPKSQIWRKLIALFGSVIIAVNICVINSKALNDSSEIEAKIYELIEEHKADTPAVSIKVFDKTDDICTIIYGKSDIENNISANEETVYEWGSVSKLLVWVSAMQLYERGQLDLNGDIRDYLPEGYLRKLKYDAPITMTNLMNHDAGFMDSYKDTETDDINGIMPLGEALDYISPSQAYHPGEVTAYSNYGAALAAYVIECISEMDFADYVHENIFDRLGMEHTAIRPDLSDNGWVADRRKLTHCYVSVNEPMGECRAYIHIYPAGAACGTIEDMAAFAKAFLCDSGNCPLFDKKGTLTEMLAPSSYYGDGETPRFCHGLRTEQYGTMLFGHGGNTSGFTALLQFDPQSETGFVMMTNIRGDRIYKGKLPELLYGKADFSAFEEPVSIKYNLSGDYLVSGGFFDTGCFRIYSFFDDRITIEESGNSYTGTLGVSELRQISDTNVYARLINGAEYIWYIRTDSDGNLAGIESGSADYIKQDKSQYITDMAVIFLMVFGYLAMVIMTLINAVRYKKYKNTDMAYYKKSELTMNLCITGFALPLAALAVLNVTADIVPVVCCIAVMVLSLLGAGINVACLIKRKGKFDVTLLLESLCNIFVIVGIIYWRLFQFWGF